MKWVRQIFISIILPGRYPDVDDVNMLMLTDQSVEYTSCPQLDNMVSVNMNLLLQSIIICYHSKALLPVHSWRANDGEFIKAVFVRIWIIWYVFYTKHLPL